MTPQPRSRRALSSLRWRLTLTYVGLLAVLLAGLGVYQYLTLRQALVENRVQGLSSDVDAAKQIFRTGVRSTISLNAAVQRFAQAISIASGHTVTVVLYDSHGERLPSGLVPAGATAPSLDPALIEDVLSGRSKSVSEVVDGVDGRQLVAGFPVDVAARDIRGVAQLSVPMTQITNVLDHELFLIVVGVLAALALATAVGVLVTGRELRPLRRLTVTARQLASGDLRARSRLVSRDDEVGELTEAFDHMAESIEDAFGALAASEERTRRFIADASHELRTPVTALKGYIDVLRRGAGRDPAALEAALEAMGRESERMRMLVLDLLTLARIDAQQSQRPEDIDVVEAVERLLDEGVPGMPAAVERLFPSGPVDAHTDRNALVTIVRNLMVNACKYAPGARQVWRITVEGARVRIDAHDDGPGIAAADLPHVFERFYRGEKTRTREEGGSGLGLAIVQGLARAQGGDAAIESAEGRGTTVTVWLPAASGGRVTPSAA